MCAFFMYRCVRVYVCVYESTQVFCQRPNAATAEHLSVCMRSSSVDLFRVGMREKRVKNVVCVFCGECLCVDVDKATAPRVRGKIGDSVCMSLCCLCTYEK